MIWIEVGVGRGFTLKKITVTSNFSSDEWTVKEVSVTERSFSEIGRSEKEEETFSELDEITCACWRSNAVIDLDVDIVLREDDVCIGQDLNI